MMPGELQKRTAHPVFTVQGWEFSNVDATRNLVCMRCGTVRRELFSRAGARVKAARYHYVDGYLHPGVGRVPRDEFRKVAVKAAWKALGTTRRK